MDFQAMACLIPDLFFGEIGWFVLVASLHDFFKRGCVILCVERLHDFCVWRVCMIFFPSLTHSGCITQVTWFFCGGCVIFFAEKLRDFWCKEVGCFFCGEDAWFFLVERLQDFFVERLYDFECVEVVWFLCVERLGYFSHSLTQVAWFIFLEVA